MNNTEITTTNNNNKTRKRFNKDEKIQLEEIFAKLEPKIKKEDKPTFYELKEMVFSENELSKSKTYLLTGEILEKQKSTVKQRGLYYGKEFFGFKINIGSSVEQIWAFTDVMDNLERDWPIVRAVATGNNYELEVQRWKGKGYQLRAIVKL